MVRKFGNCGFWPTFSGFWPTFKMKLGNEKASVYAGLRGFGPLTHFYFYLIVIKSLIYIKELAQKSGFLGQSINLTEKGDNDGK